MSSKARCARAATGCASPAQLIDAVTGTHLWADRFDGLLEDVFELQDKIAISVAGVIEPALQAAEMRRSAARPTTDLTAYDLYLRAFAAFYPITKERILEALGLLEQAIAIDPALRAGTCLGGDLPPAARHRRLGRRAGDIRRKAIDFARQALKVARERPRHPRQRRLRAG